ncbi:MAG: tRNA (adenosine(37)-N6)-threonylcarbamoyltransferase complex dimerization subunit type 1 TsaB [Desulfovibrio sp.]|nr:tRNA (adenosine(37)-N6)-threonylcarbamoyltransferase complex dimerization subunit type 1 TsaB [Desulfovibrio sp.]
MVRERVMIHGTGLELILNAAEGALQILITEEERLICAQQWHRPERGVEILTPALALMCRTLGIKPTDFRRIACVRGPGSFTGIRLVLSTAASLRRTGQAQLAGLDYMQALATSVAQRRSLPYGVRIWTLTHARRNLMHCQLFVSYGPRIPAQPLDRVELRTPQEALRYLQESIESQVTCVWVCGSGLVRNRSVFQSLDGMGELPLPVDSRMVALPDLTLPDNAALCLLARHGDYLDEDVEPLYVRPCDAVENLPQLARRMGMTGEDACAALKARLELAPHSEI